MMGWIENGPEKKLRWFFIRQQHPAKTEIALFALSVLHRLQYSCSILGEHVFS